jgi:type II secretory pathway predicted ATPase ExeA
MLIDYYKLSEQPFGVTPDPRFLYLGAQHREALASLEYTLESNRGFVAVIAKPGMGKTSILYHYLEGLRQRAQTAFVFRTDCNAREFMRHVLLDLGLDLPIDDLPAMHDALNRVLMEGRSEKRLPFVLVIDEAQNLSESVLESIRLLSNFETPWMKLMHIVLAGQPSLAERLAQPSMVQLRQRIAQIIRIEPLNPEEVSEYIDCRLEASGCQDLSLFTSGARRAIAHFSEGIPRNINTICFGAMSLACAMKRSTVDRNIVVEAMSDLDLGPAADIEIKASERAESEKASVARLRVSRTEGRTLVHWIPRFVMGALALAIFFLGFSLSVDAPWTTAMAGMSTKMPAKAEAVISVEPESAVVPKPAHPKPATSAPPQGPVLAPFGETLYGVGQSAFGRDNIGALSEIQKPNPWPSNLNPIPKGQEIPPRTSTGISDSTQRGATPTMLPGRQSRPNE